MWTLSLQRRCDVHGGVGDDEWTLMPRHVHDEAMADPAYRAQAAFAANDSAHEFVGMQTPLHQRFCAARPDEIDRCRRGGLAVRCLHDAERGGVLVERLCDSLDLFRWPNEDRFDEAKLRGLEHSTEGSCIAGIGD